ncbi:hypothetical protein [Kyrpidia tusciae]|uniref:Uncharacterized protein n=1 Tax=Kyrpidia tusciae (strain DSM 2912 / NBRC 15312 / T2) TaxID=562970 RepID=D5WV54_KYRT2|nr:hypothetical protein [Kyrpidia tusciae]ADG07526.1 conserved hypothetical protein [Kyrpidia tusciae DSM 2912]
MSLEIILRPRLTGRRFEEHGIPLELFKDFVALEEMIVEVAKYHYLKDHPERQRVPRGFTDGVTLKLLKVDKGSAVPLIAVTQTIPEQLTLFPIAPTTITYLKRAIETITKVIDESSNSEAVRKRLPEKFLGYFDRIGRSLREDEAIEFPLEGENRCARLTLETRKKLIQASHSKELTNEIQLRGMVPEVDKDLNTFHVQLVDGSKVKIPLAMQYRDAVLEAFNGYSNRVRILVQGIGKFRLDGKLVGVESVEHVTLLDPLDVRARLEELAALEDGWLDGEGKKLDSSGLRWFGERFSQLFPEDLPLPYAYPTVEGNLRLEWTFGTREVSLEVMLDDHLGQWHVLDVDTDDEDSRQLNLDEDRDWTYVFSNLKQYDVKGTDQ